MNDNSIQTSIDASDIRRVYWDGNRKLEVLSGVSLKVKKGERVAIWGPSGSGKTTLLNVLSGLDVPDGGAVRLAGVEIGKLGEPELADFRNRRLGFVFQFYHLLSEFTALENVLLPAWIAGNRSKEATARAESLLEKMGLADRRSHYPSELSGGEQQRAAIARALMNDPEILFCDEPTGNLDRKMGAEVAELLASLTETHEKTVLLVTHDERIAKMADRTWSMIRNDWEA